jgi:hypothetical protein
LNYDEANAHSNINEENDLDEPLIQPLFSEEEASQILKGII